MKSLRLICLVGFGLSLTGCGKSPPPTAEQIAKLHFSMTIEQVEAILGPGRDIDPPANAAAPPPEVFRGVPADMQAKMKSTMRSNPTMFTWKQWGNSSQNVALGFSNGKLVQSVFTKIDGMIGRDPNVPKIPGLEPGGPSRPIDPKNFEADFRRSSGYHSDMASLGFSIRDYAREHPTVTPADLSGLEEGFFKPSPELKAMIQSGEIVVIWNAMKGSKIVAYPKMILESKAMYLDGEGNLKDGTPELVKQLLQESK